MTHTNERTQGWTNQRTAQSKSICVSICRSEILSPRTAPRDMKIQTVEQGTNDKYDDFACSHFPFGPNNRYGAARRCARSTGRACQDQGTRIT